MRVCRPKDRSRREILTAACAVAVVDLKALGLQPSSYVVGSSPTGVPFSFIDIHTFALTGALVDVTKAVARNADFEAEFKETAFSALIPSLLARKIDIIAAAMLRTAPREKVVDFSAPVCSYGAGLVVRSTDQRMYRTLADLRGLTVGAQVGTRYVEQLQSAGPKEVKTYDSLYDILRDLRFGRIEAGYGDAPILRYELDKIQPDNVRYVRSFHPPSREDVCLIVRKGETQLLSRINASIGRIRETSIQAILARWNIEEP
jgi:polar amino acid transport system substrate-binding protein